MAETSHPAQRDVGGERARLVALPGGQSGLRGRTPLPSEVSSFVGREHELSEVVRLLREHRLVTLTGVGGSGKTRLALAVAAELDEIFADGVCVVELAQAADPELLPRMVASATGIGERPGQPLTETLTEVLRGRSALLVLDNCEHLIDASAALAEALLRRCPMMRILATSREPLGIRGEVAWPVPALKEAVELFTERAAAVRPSFALTDESAAAVARIVRQLDGLPLAVELAATRVRVLSVQEIADRLGEVLRLLVGDRTTTARHHTLEATFDWSHQLLSPAEQTLFRRLSIFRGGFTLTAAERVCTGAELPSPDVLDILSLLVEKSLVIADPTNGSTRYRLLEVIRQYGGKRLAAAGEDDAVAARHAVYFRDLADEAERKSNGLDERSWFDRLSIEHDNFRAALTWLTGPGPDGPDAAQLAAALWPFWFVRGFPVEGIGWLRSAIRRCRDEDRASRAKALNGLVVLATFQEDYDLAWASGQESLTLYRELDDADGIASALTALSTTAVAGQRPDVAVADLLAEARALQPRLRNRRAAAYVLDIEGVLALQGGDPLLAIARWQEAVALHSELGNQLGRAFILADLGLLAARLGHTESAGAWLDQSLRVSRDLDYKLIVMYGLIGMGRLAADGGRPGRAARLWGAADSMSEAYGAHLTRASRAVVDYDNELARTRQRLDPAAWSAAWDEGRRMTIDQAVAYALKEGDPAKVLPPAPHPAGLTDREMDVLRLVAAGLTSAEVGHRLFLSPRTVDWHLSAVYVKLGVRSRIEAARFALQHGLA